MEERESNLPDRAAVVADLTQIRKLGWETPEPIARLGALYELLPADSRPSRQDAPAVAEAIKAMFEDVVAEIGNEEAVKPPRLNRSHAFAGKLLLRLQPPEGVNPAYVESVADIFLEICTKWQVWDKKRKQLKGMNDATFRVTHAPKVYEDIAGRLLQTASRKSDADDSRSPAPPLCLPAIGRTEVADLYKPIEPDDLEERFFKRRSTKEYIEALASLDAVTLYAGAGVSTEVGAPLSDELMPWILSERLFAVDPDASETQRRRVIAALKAAYSPAYLGSIAREYERRHREEDGQDDRATFAHDLRSAYRAGRNTGGFLARSIGVLAFALRQAGKPVQVLTTNYDDKIYDETKNIHSYFAGLQDFAFHKYPLSSSDCNDEHKIPLYHLNGELKNESGDPLIIGEADFFGRYGNDLAPLSSQHDSRSEILNKVFGESACLFIGSSLTNPDLLAKLANTKYLQPRYAIVLTPQLHLKDRRDRAHALNLIAQRFLHLGVVPIIINSPHQAPQLLVEVALRLQQGSAYKGYSERLDDWSRSLPKGFGYSPTSNSGKRDDELQRTWMNELAAVRDKIADEHLGLPGNHANRDEQIQVEVWIRRPRQRRMVLWANSEGVWMNGKTADICDIRKDDDFPAQRAFRRGKAVFGPIKPPRGRWHYHLSIPLVLHEAPWYHLPVGVASVLSSRGEGIKNEDGSDEEGGRLSAFTKRNDLASELARLESTVKDTVNGLLDPDPKRRKGRQNSRSKRKTRK